MGRRRTDRRQHTARRDSRRGRGSRRRKRPHTRLLASVLTLGAFAGSGFLVVQQGTGASDETAAGDTLESTVSPAPSPSVPDSAAPSASPSVSAPASPSTSASSSPSATASPGKTPGENPEKKTEVPATGPGTFTTGRAGGETVGKGTIRTYRVQVEDGAGVSAGQAAREVAAILAHPRGWTNDGVSGFRPASSGTADLTVKIATPGTADALCGAAGLNTRGELNCSIGGTVVVNLRRWVLGSPQFSGPVSEYRALIINHEVGHSIGHGHETCPGPGRPAPAMMQQIKGLKGCVANAWPYDENGKYLGGPSVP
ncbi:hypothetical protein CUT44_12695 [Streptomyces carminius]|uniref:DUF3152 domain-containing protein n=1 Tax=Streptomyces carminius TaxID=2665496 RepID=A0A2M8LZY8_9ACTN|nr:DUF3152 domain-containing protein [Streptomyces carminius]PJE97527.1 hypothetical protein CUT44_12695 [Streptomyces carminius]